jgi:hypothetical protein
MARAVSCGPPGIRDFALRLRRGIAAVDKTIVKIRPTRPLEVDETAQPRFRTLLLLRLRHALGIARLEYGVVAYAVSRAPRRSNCIALGATSVRCS